MHIVRCTTPSSFSKACVCSTHQARLQRLPALGGRGHRADEKIQHYREILARTQHTMCQSATATRPHVHCGGQVACELYPCHDSSISACVHTTLSHYLIPGDMPGCELGQQSGTSSSHHHQCIIRTNATYSRATNAATCRYDACCEGTWAGPMAQLAQARLNR